MSRQSWQYYGVFGYYYYEGTSELMRYVSWHHAFASGMYIKEGLPSSTLVSYGYQSTYTTTPAYYAYTKAYYAYTAARYNIIPAYYQYIAAVYQYTAAKYYQPIWYQYQTI